MTKRNLRIVDVSEAAAPISGNLWSDLDRKVLDYVRSIGWEVNRVTAPSGDLVHEATPLVTLADAGAVSVVAPTVGDLVRKVSVETERARARQARRRA